MMISTSEEIGRNKIKGEFAVKLPKKHFSVENTSAHSMRQNEKDAMTSRCLDRKEV